jgi:two-component SAPR family response regulator
MAINGGVPLAAQYAGQSASVQARAALTAEIYFKLGELSEALQFGQLAIGNDPCSEAIHRLLMRCYASQHQQ